MGLKKTHGIIFTLESVLVLLFLLIVFGGGIYSGSYAVSNYRTSVLQYDCDAIDRALEMYSKAHQAVRTDTVSTDPISEQLVYEKSRVYPKDLSELGVIQSEDGYFTTKINLSGFSYQTKTDSNGKMTYELGVNLPNGTYYTSLRSNT